MLRRSSIPRQSYFKSLHFYIRIRPIKQQRELSGKIYNMYSKNRTNERGSLTYHDPLTRLSFRLAILGKKSQSPWLVVLVPISDLLVQDRTV